MSALVQVVVAGPTLKKFTPAPITSSSAFAPDGVVPSRGGPFASTIGKLFAPFNRTVPFASRLVEVAAAPATQRSERPATSGQTSRFTGATPYGRTSVRTYHRGALLPSVRTTPNLVRCANQVRV